MFVENGKISKRQFLVLLCFAQFGTAILFLPTELARAGGKNGWQTFFVWGAILLLVQGLFCCLCKRNPSLPITKWYEYAFGKVAGRVISIGLLAHLLFLGAIELRIFGEVISGMLLPKTPLWMVMLVFLLGCLPVALGGVEVAGRMSEVLFFFVGIPLVFVLLALTVSADFGRLLPLEIVDGEAVQKTAIYFAPLSQGLVCTPFFFAHTKWKKGSGSVSAVGVVFVMLMVLFYMTILAFSTYGGEVLLGKLFPVLGMMEHMGLANVFWSRQDLLFLWFWVVSAYLFLSMILLFVAKIGYGVLAKPESQKRGRWCVFWCAMLWVIANAPEDLWTAYDLRLAYLPYGNLLFLVVLPVCLLLVDFAKRGRGHE